MLSDFWQRIMNILILISPVLLFLFGIDIGLLIDLLDQLVVQIVLIYTTIDQIVKIVRGWFIAKLTLSFKQYRSLSTARIYTLQSRHELQATA